MFYGVASFSPSSHSVAKLKFKRNWRNWHWHEIESCCCCPRNDYVWLGRMGSGLVQFVVQWPHLKSGSSPDDGTSLCREYCMLCIFVDNMFFWNLCNFEYYIQSEKAIITKWYCDLFLQQFNQNILVTEGWREVSLNNTKNNVYNLVNSLYNEFQNEDFLARIIHLSNKELRRML